MNEILNNGKREEQLFQHHAKAKVKLFSDALIYCQQYTPIEKKDYKEFSNNFKSFMVKRLKSKCGGFADEWTDSKLLEFYDCSESMINTIQSRYSQHKQIQLTDCFTSYILPDFKLYCVTDIEKKRLKTINKLLEALAELKQDRWSINYLTIAQGVGFAIEATSQTARPAPRYIKQRERK